MLQTIYSFSFSFKPPWVNKANSNYSNRVIVTPANNLVSNLSYSNSRIIRIKNAEFSGYCFYVNPNI